MIQFLTYAALFNFSITLLEWLSDLKSNKRNFKEDFLSFKIGAGYLILEQTLLKTLPYIPLFIVAEFITWTWSEPTWINWVISIIIADFTYYWMHRFEHLIPILWAHHTTHHNSEEFNLITGYRLSWVEPLVEWVFFLPMILIGIPPFQVLISIAFVATYQHWIHTQKIKRLGWLDTVFNTPSVHRVHHGANEWCIDKNFGGILMIWDHLFGTYQKEIDSVGFGVVPQLEDKTAFAANFSYYGKLIEASRKKKLLKEKIKVFLSPIPTAKGEPYEKNRR